MRQISFEGALRSGARAAGEVLTPT
jgi:hypothetical protein